MKLLALNFGIVRVVALAAVAACLFAAPSLAQQRRLAPGVLTTIAPEPQETEMFDGPRPLVEVPIAIPNLEYKPHLAPKSDTIFERAKQETLRRTIWNLEFSFKPLRMVEVEIPQANGRMQRKNIWYMVYRIRNPGQHWKPVKVTEEFRDRKEPAFTHTKYTKELTDKVEIFGRKDPIEELRFFPQFVLEAPEFKKAYLDRVIPAALAPIKAREFPTEPDVKLYDSQQIGEIPIGVSRPDADKSVWGVVCWEDVDPRADYLSIFIQGLTNAYKYEDPQGAYKKGESPGTGRKLTQKTLRLNFWRPGDAIDENDREIRYGMRIDSDAVEQAKIYALFGVNERLDYQWLYR